MMFIKRTAAAIVATTFLASSLTFADPNDGRKVRKAHRGNLKKQSAPSAAAERPEELPTLRGKLVRDANGSYSVEQIGTSGLQPYFDFATKAPTGYRTIDKNCTSSPWSLVNETRCADLDEGFTTFSTNWGETLILNTLGQAFFLMPLISHGVAVERTASFDRDEYEGAVNSAMTKVDVQGISKRYDDLTGKIHSSVEEHNRMVANRFDQIRAKYQAIEEANQQRVAIKTIIEDRTGLWSSSRQLPTLSFQGNQLEARNPRFTYTFNGIAPTAPSEVVAEIAKADAALDASIAAHTAKLPGWEAQYEGELAKLSAELQLPHQENYTVDNFAIEVKAPFTVSVGPETGSVVAAYTIKSLDCSNVFPQYSNGDGNVEVRLNGETLRISNKTQKYVTISALTAYYNSEVSNYSADLELPPETFKDVAASTVLGGNGIKREASYNDVDKAKAANTDFTFGLAVKYRIVDTNLEKSFYKTYKYNLGKVLKASL
jgi:hypothetical protein